MHSRRLALLCVSTSLLACDASESSDADPRAAGRTPIQATRPAPGNTSAPQPSPPPAPSTRPTCSPGSWPIVGQPSALRQQGRAHVLPSGVVLIDGGLPYWSTDYTVFTWPAELYAPPNLNTRLSVHPPQYWLVQSLQLHDGTVLASGRTDMHWPSGVPDVLLRYVPETDDWEKVGTLSSGFSHKTQAMAELPDGRVLLLQEPVNDTQTEFVSLVWDPSTRTTTSTGPCPIHHNAGTLTALPDGRVLYAGGWQGPSNTALRQPTQRAFVYEPRTGQWSETDRMMRSRALHTATLLQDGRVLLAGGTSDGAIFREFTEVYTPQTGRFQHAGDLAHSAYFHHSAVRMPSGEVLLIKGPDTLEPASAELFDPTTLRWWPAAAPPQGYSGEGASVLLPDGAALVVGDTPTITTGRSASASAPSTASTAPRRSEGPRGASGARPRCPRARPRTSPSTSRSPLARVASVASPNTPLAEYTPGSAGLAPQRALGPGGSP